MMRNVRDIIGASVLVLLVWFSIDGILPMGEAITDHYLVDDSGLNRGRVQVVMWSGWFSSSVNQYSVVTVQSPPFGITAVTDRETKYESLTLFPRGIWSHISSGERWEPVKEGLYNFHRIGGARETVRAPAYVPTLFHEGREAIFRQGR